MGPEDWGAPPADAAAAAGVGTIGMSGLTAFAPTETGISPHVLGADPAIGPVADDGLGSIAAGRAADRQSMVEYAADSPPARMTPEQRNAYVDTLQLTAFGIAGALKAAESWVSANSLQNAQGILGRAPSLHEPALKSLSFNTAGPLQQTVAVTRGMYSPIDKILGTAGVKSPMTSAAQVYSPNHWNYSAAAKSTQALHEVAPLAQNLGRVAKGAGVVGFVAGPLFDAYTGYTNPAHQTRTDRWTGSVMGALRGLDNGAVQFGGALTGAAAGSLAGGAVTAPTGGWGAVPGGYMGAVSGGVGLGMAYQDSVVDKGFNSLVNAAEPAVRTGAQLAEKAYDTAAPVVSAAAGMVNSAYDKASSVVSDLAGQASGMFSKD